MKKQITCKHKLTSFLFVLLLILSISLQSFATTSALTSQNEALPLTTASVNDIINMYSNTNSITYSIINTFPLESISGGSSYTLYQLNPYGYAILLDETQSLMEACYAKDSTFPVSVSNKGTIYYGGPGIYCVKSGDNYYNLATNTVLTSSELSGITLSETYVQNTQKQHYMSSTARSSQRASMSYSAGYDYFSSLTDFGLNTNGTCTVIAAQMLLNYYDNFINSGFIATQYDEGNGSSESFHQLLCDYVYGTNPQGGIFIHDASNGITNYLLETGLHYSLESEYSSPNNAVAKIIATLISGKPAIASMSQAYNAPWEHSVLVYSVTFDSANPVPTAVLTMNMGWKNSGSQYLSYVASASWFYECGYLSNNSSIHTMNAWEDVNTLYHTRSCSSCSFTEKGFHCDVWDSVNRRCTLCPRMGTCVFVSQGYSGTPTLNPQ